ncbi:MAG: hypothetical protein ACRDVG_00880 [Jatrophihabitantaceae bacterium]
MYYPDNHLDVGCDALSVLVADHHRTLVAQARAARRVAQARADRRKRTRPGWRWRPRWTLPAPARPATTAAATTS